MKLIALLLIEIIALIVSKPTCCENCGTQLLSTLQVEFNPDCYKKPICSYECPCNKTVYFEMKSEKEIKRYENVCNNPKQEKIRNIFTKHFHVAFQQVQREFQMLIRSQNGRRLLSVDSLFMRNMFKTPNFHAAEMNRQRLKQQQEQQKRNSVNGRIERLFRASNEICSKISSFIPLIKRLCQGKGKNSPINFLNELYKDKNGSLGNYPSYLQIMAKSTLAESAKVLSELCHCKKVFPNLEEKALKQCQCNESGEDQE